MKCTQSFLVGYVECHASTVCDCVTVAIATIKAIIAIVIVVLVVVFILLKSRKRYINKLCTQLVYTVFYLNL
jgi:hypothetical protein